MYITCDQHTKLTHRLFDVMIDLRDSGEKKIKAYEVAFQNAIEEVFPEQHWYDMTECDIYQHLKEYKNPRETLIAILKGLKEDE